MDLQSIVDKFHTMTSILSVEKRDDDKIGMIRIEAGNAPYIHAMEKMDSDGNVIFKEKFVPGSSYERYMKKELNFENFCYECAIKKKPVHAYIRPERYNFCINLIMMPLSIEDPKKAYCTYSQEITFEESVEGLSNLSAEASSTILKTCIKLRSTQNMRKTMDEVIDDIREICGAEYCCILLTDFSEHSCTVFSDSLKEGTKLQSIRGILDEDFINYAKTWMDILAGSNCLMIKNEDDFIFIKQKNPEWYKSLRNASVNSLVLLPLHYGSTLLGFIWVANFNTSNTLRIKETLELSTFFIASEIANYQLLGKLEMLSNIDLLTGVKNRNAMNNRVTEFIEGRVPHNTLAVVFADLNGLKPINDNKGHEAGDTLLKDASWILKQTFVGGEVYRAGGDEFLIIILDQPKDYLEQKIKKLHDKSEIPDHVSFSFGFYYDDNGGDIRKAMHEADVLMYEDKRQFYKRHPERKAR